MMLIRRALGYAGVASAVGLDGEVFQVGGTVMATAMALWSVYLKIQAYRNKAN